MIIVIIRMNLCTLLAVTLMTEICPENVHILNYVRDVYVHLVVSSHGTRMRIKTKPFVDGY